MLIYYSPHAQLHSTNGYMSLERGNGEAVLRPNARRRARVVVEAENINYYSLF